MVVQYVQVSNRATVECKCDAADALKYMAMAVSNRATVECKLKPLVQVMEELKFLIELQQNVNMIFRNKITERLEISNRATVECKYQNRRELQNLRTFSNRATVECKLMLMVLVAILGVNF